MKKIVLLTCILALAMQAYSQSLRSESGYVRFFSSAMLEDITAKNTKATGVFNPVSGEVAFLIPISEFEFRKSLMKEHFNENYLESDKFPEAYFRGKISGYTPGNPQSNAVAEGDLTIHGVTKPVKIQGTIAEKGGRIEMQAVFKVLLKDYNVDIPRLMFQNIAEEVEVTIKFEFKNQN
ncbi:YceI family protein [Algoriphagus sp. NG3]|uniref:YceI family protein n=1 Tax=unclassified Algoriphagus TaxID=2641541 RepID=UPI002A801960|nr:YceI family protein [Algoriphagus sp. NG3]WPR75157.1 YceI family protein [Algoriphagus sp. NG3]